MDEGREYLNFRLRVRTTPAAQPWTDLESPAGSAVAPFTPPFAADDALCWLAEVERLVRRDQGARAWRDIALAAAPETPRSLAADGKLLFKALIAEEVAKKYGNALAAVRATGGREALRILVQVDASDERLTQIGTLPWELLADPGDERHLALDRNTPVSRLFLRDALRLRRISDRLRVLLVMGAKTGDLEIDQEVERIHAALAGRHDIDVETLSPPSLHHLYNRLLREACHVVHFMGHGGFHPETGDAVLWFQGGDGTDMRFTAAQLADHFRNASDLRLVVLNACSTGMMPRRRGEAPPLVLATALVEARVPAVVAMQFPISDAAAIAFSDQLYASLAAGDRIDAAVVDGRLAIQSLGSNEWVTPTLFTRLEHADALAVERRADADPLPSGRGGSDMSAGAPGGLPQPSLAGAGRDHTARDRPRWRDEPLVLGVVSAAAGEQATALRSRLEMEGAAVLELNLYATRTFRSSQRGGGFFRGEPSRPVWNPHRDRAALRELRAFLATAAAERRPLELHLAADSSTALAAGWCLQGKSSLAVTVHDHTAPPHDWRPRPGAEEEGPYFQAEPPLEADPEAVDVACAAGFANLLAIRNSLALTGTRVRRIDAFTLGPAPAAPRDGVHALALAHNLVAHLRRLTADHRDGVLHLFVSSSSLPAAFQFYLGQLSHHFARVQLYEDRGQGSTLYLPSILLAQAQAEAAEPLQLEGPPAPRTVRVPGAGVQERYRATLRRSKLLDLDPPSDPLVLGVSPELLGDRMADAKAESKPKAKAPGAPGAEDDDERPLPSPGG